MRIYLDYWTIYNNLVYSKYYQRTHTHMISSHSCSICSNFKSKCWFTNQYLDLTTRASSHHLKFFQAIHILVNDLENACVHPPQHKQTRSGPHNHIRYWQTWYFVIHFPQRGNKSASLSHLTQPTTTVISNMSLSSLWLQLTMILHRHAQTSSGG